MSESRRHPPAWGGSIQKGRQEKAPVDNSSSLVSDFMWSLPPEGYPALIGGAIGGGLYINHEYSAQIKDFVIDNKEALIGAAGAVAIVALGAILKMAYDSYQKHQARNELTQPAKGSEVELPQVKNLEEYQSPSPTRR